LLLLLPLLLLLLLLLLPLLQLQKLLLLLLVLLLMLLLLLLKLLELLELHVNRQKTARAPASVFTSAAAILGCHRRVVPGLLSSHARVHPNTHL
jgi:hypothetical protein